MTNSGKVLGSTKKELKLLLTLLGGIALVLVINSLLFFGGIKIPVVDVGPAKEQFAVTGFSPDSKKLYLVFVDTSRQVRSGWMNLSTKQVTLFVPQNTQDQLAFLSSSADDKQLAIVIKSAASNYEKSQIGILDLKSNTYRAITKSDSYKQFPSFSPDGKKIIYAQAGHRRTSGMTHFSDWDIYEVDVATSVERKLTDFSFFQISQPFYLSRKRKEICIFRGFTQVLK